MTATESATVLGRSVKLQGELSGAEDLLIEGQFSGTIRMVGGRVTIGREALVRAQIAARDVVIYGSLEGEVRAAGSVMLREKAAVLGDVLTPRFSMEEGTTLRGRVDPSRAEEPFPLAVAVAAEPAKHQPALAFVSERYPAAKPQPLELFTKPEAGRGASFGHMPAGLAAAARNFQAPATAEPSSTFDSPSELSETEA